LPDEVRLRTSCHGAAVFALRCAPGEDWTLWDKVQTYFGEKSSLKRYFRTIWRGSRSASAVQVLEQGHDGNDWAFGGGGVDWPAQVFRLPTAFGRCSLAALKRSVSRCANLFPASEGAFKGGGGVGRQNQTVRHGGWLVWLFINLIFLIGCRGCFAVFFN
jgi:hypothetical protein